MLTTRFSSHLVVFGCLVVLCLLFGLTSSINAQPEGSERHDALRESIPGLATLANRADLILIGRAAGVASEYAVNEWGDKLIVSDVDILIEEVLKGDAEANQDLTLNGVVGGQVGDIVMRSSVAPLFVQGESFVLFLQARTGGDFHIVGGDFGKFNVGASGDLPQLGRTLNEFRDELQGILSGEPQVLSARGYSPGYAANWGGPVRDPNAPGYELIGIRWPGIFPVVPFLVNNPGFDGDNPGTLEQQNAAFTQASQTLGDTGGARFAYRFAGLTNSPASFDYKNVIIVRREPHYALASANYWYAPSSNTTLDCDITFYDYGRDFSAIDSPQSFDIESVALHELGHCLGLDHSPIKEAVMYYSIGSREFKRELHPDDLAGIRSIYGTIELRELYLPATIR